MAIIVLRHPMSQNGGPDVADGSEMSENVG
jgi:hypothetical protein